MQDSTYLGGTIVGNAVMSRTLMAQTLMTQSTTTEVLRGPTGTLYLDGDMSISGNIVANVSTNLALKSMTATANIYVGGTVKAASFDGSLTGTQIVGPIGPSVTSINVGSGTVSANSITATGNVTALNLVGLTVSANGAALNSLNAANVSWGKFANERLPANISVGGTVKAASFDGSLTGSQIVGPIGPSVTSIDVGSGTLSANSITASDSIQAKNVTASSNIVGSNVSATTVVASNISVTGYYRGDGSLLTNVKSTFQSPIYNSIQTDVATGMVVDGDLFQHNGSIYGSGAGLTGFSEKTNPSLEARLSSYANSKRRLYVSTTGSDKNHGKSVDKALRTIKKAASMAITQTVIFVESGTYVEDNPIYVPPNVSIVGDSLRNVVLLAANPRLDYLHVTNMNYITQLRFVDLRSPGFCAAFPCSLAAVNIFAGRVVPQETGETVRVPVLYSPEAPNGYYIENLPPGADASPDGVTQIDVITALTAGMADIIEKGTSVGDFGADAKNNAGGYRRASVYLEAHIPFLQAETMAWVAINVPTLTTQQRTLCKRDVAYIVKALVTDLTKGGYVASLEAALKYYKGAVSVLSSGTKEKTAESIKRIGELAGYIATGTPVPPGTRLALGSIQTFFAFAGTETSVSPENGIDAAVVRMRALFDFVALVIRSPSISAALEKIDVGGELEQLGNSARSTLQSAGTARAATLLKKSKDALRASILAWLEQQQSDPQGIQLTDANKVKCARDVGYIVEGIVFDLLNGSYEKTLEYASVYFNATGASVLPTNQVNKTADAIVYLKEKAVVFTYNTTLPINVFDKNIETSYESLLTYPNYGGIRDAPGVTISVQLPGPTMYVGYRLRRSNLKKWRLEARETSTAEWTVIGIEDIPAPQPLVDDVDELNEAVAYAKALCEGIASIILAPEEKFPPAASGNAGGYTRASAILLANKAFIQAEVIAWVATQEVFASLSSETKALCKRDVGFIVDALVGDLRIGGFGKSLEAAMAYYNGTVSKLTTPNSREPTADSIRRIGILAERIILNTPISEEVRLQAQVLQVYDEGTESVITYGTEALTGYSFYRIVMLQTHDSSSFKLGSIEFLEMQLPSILVDGPNDTVGLNTVIRGFEIADGGAGYTDGTVEVVIALKNPPAGGRYPDQEDAEADATIVGGKVTNIVMRKRLYSSVQSLAIDSGGKGYVYAPTVTMSGNAKAKAWIDLAGSVVRLEVVDGGSGYVGVAPTVTFSAPPVGGEIATATASVQGSTEPGYEWSLLRGRYYQGGATVSIPGGSLPARVFAIMTDDFAEMRAPIYEVGSAGTSRNVDGRGRLKSLQLMHPGSGYSQTLGLSPTISIPPPESIQPIIVGSPYLQNCSNLSGPWDSTGEKVPVTWRLPWDPNNIYNVESDITTYNSANTSDENKGLRKLDNSGAGGGARIDGRCCAPLSPLRSFVVDAFTQLCQGGIGFLLVNLAYAQFVSTFGTFCNIHSLATGGSFGNFSNSVTDFGRRGLIAQGYYRDPYLSGSIAPLPTTGLTSDELAKKNYVKPIDGSMPYYASSISLLKFKPNTEGKGYAVRPNDSTWPRLTISSPGSEPGHIQALGSVKIKALESGQTSAGLFQLQVLTSGGGYKVPPTVTIDPPTSNYIPSDNLQQAEATASLSGVSKVRVTITRGLPLRFANNRRPDTGSIVRIHGEFYTVFSATEVDEVGTPKGTYEITFKGAAGAPPYADIGHEIDFFFVSSISTGGHVFEYCGDDKNGCTYNSLPEYGGNYTESNQIIAVPPATIFYTSSDHEGKQKIGSLFFVDQANGKVSFDAKSFELNRIAGLGPFLRNNVVQGVKMEEVSSSVELISSAGMADDAAVPTQYAVKTYIDKRAVPSIDTGATGYVLRINRFGTGYEWGPNTVEKLGVVQVTLRADVITGLIADGDATVYGNLLCDTVIADVKANTIYAPTFNGTTPAFVPPSKMLPAVWGGAENTVGALGTLEVSQLVAVDDIAGSLNNTYFTVSAPTLTSGLIDYTVETSDQFTVWFNVGGAGVQPIVANTVTYVAVPLATNAAATTVAAAISTALSAFPALFRVGTESATVRIVAQRPGNMTDIGAGTSGMIVSVLTQGSGSLGTQSFKYSDAVTGPNGKIYFIPLAATNVGILDPATGIVDTTSITGLDGLGKWQGGVLANGKIFCIPYRATTVLIIDCATDTAEQTSITGLLTGSFYGGALDRTGRYIYCAPFESTSVLIIDTVNRTADTTSISGLSPGTDKWSGAVLAPNNRIYMVPFQSTTVLIVDPVTNTAEQTSITGLTGNYKWMGGCLAPNGKIYCCPLYSASVLIIDPVTNTADTTKIAGLGASLNKWAGSVLAPNGKIYFSPYANSNILVVDPISDTYKTIPGVGGSQLFKYRNAALGPNGRVFFVPYNAKYVLTVDTGPQAPQLALGPQTLINANVGTAALPTYSFATNPNTGSFSPGANAFAVSTGGVERMRVDSVGRVGIGTTAPDDNSALHVVGNAYVTGTVTSNSIARLLPTISGASGIVTHDVNMGSVWYHTSPAANFTCALVNVPTPTTRRVYEITLVVAQGTTPYMPTALSIEGVMRAIRWKSNTVPTGTASGVDTVNFKLLWLIGTWLIVGS